MKYFFDTEFHEYEIRDDAYHDKRPTIDLISIGIVAEDGREFYRVSDEFSIHPACGNEWLLENVIKPLCKEIDPDVEWDDRSHITANTIYDIITQNRTKSDVVKSNHNIKNDIINFIGDDADPQFYAYYADYDWVVFCWLFGRMIDLPKGFPMYCRDLKQMVDEYVERASVYISPTGAFSLDEFKLHPDYPKQENKHNALDDARWNKSLYGFLASLDAT